MTHVTNISGKFRLLQTPKNIDAGLSQAVKYLKIIIFFGCVCTSAFSQSIDSELKKDLWKTIKPEGRRNPMPLDSAQEMRRLPPKTMSTIPSVHLRRKDLLPSEKIKDRSKDTFKIDPHAYTPTAEELNKIDANSGMSISQFNGLIVNSSKNNGGGGGLTLGILEKGQAKLSQKTKKILKEVYGVSDKELEGK